MQSINLTRSWALVFSLVAVFGLSSCGGGEGSGSERGPFSQNDLVGKWAVTRIEGIPGSVGGPDDVDESNSVFTFRFDGTYEWFFLFQRDPFFFDIDGGGTYSLDNSTLAFDGVVADSILDLLTEKTAEIRVSGDHNSFSFVDDEGDRWTYLRIPSRLSDLLSFPDEGLADCVEATMASTIGAVDELWCLDMSIADLSGIEYLTSLSALILDRNQVSDLSPLGQLTALTALRLPSNNVSNINPIAALTSLEFLDLSNNPLTDFGPVFGLPDIEQLAVADTGFDNADLAILGANYPGLISLNVRGSSVTDIGPVAALTGLLYLYAGNLGISDLAAISGLSQLTALELGQNNITDISALAGLEDIWTLDLRFNNVTDFDAVASLTDLEFLSLGTAQFPQPSDDLVTTLTGLPIFRQITFYGPDVIDCSDQEDLSTALGAGISVAVPGSPCP